MTPDEVNRAAILGILGIVVVLAVVYTANWALGEDGAPTAVAGVTLDTATATESESIAEVETVPTVADDAPVAAIGPSAPVETSTDTPDPSTTTSPATTTTTPATPSTTSSTTSTTTPGSTSTTVRPTTTTTVRPTTTTTVGPTTTTTVRPTTTTTVKPTTTTTTTKPPPTTTTTTTVPATTTTTTTTVPPTTTTTTTTTTTVPPTTTTTTIPLPGLLVHKFDGHDHGDEGEWEAHIKIEIRDEFDDDAGYAAVRVTWGGVAPGSMWLGTDKDGKVDTRLGPFADASLTFRITNVTLTGFVYRPSLNEAGTTLLIEGPD